MENDIKHENSILLKLKTASLSGSRKEIFFSLLPWICLAGAYLAAVLFQLIYGEKLINSDMSAEIILADELNKSGEWIISKNWYYSTELRVLNQQLTLQLGLLLFPGNWHLARTFSMAVLLAIHGACFLFLMRECRLGKIGVYCTAILMCPFGFWYMWYGTWGTFYLPHMIQICLNLALLLHFVRGEKHGGICLLGGGVLAFVEGLGGVRMLMNFFIPLCAAALIMIFLCLQQEEVKGFSDAAGQIRLGGASLAMTAVCGLGYLINMKVLSSEYTFSVHSGQYWLELNLNRFITVFGQFLSLFGYPYQINYSEDQWQVTYLFSKNGILGAFGLVLVLAVAYSIVRLVSRWKELCESHRVVLLTLCMCLLVDGIVYCCLTEEYDINASYWLPLVPLGIAVLAIEMKTEYFHYAALRSTVLACLLVSVLLCSAGTASQFVKNSPRTVKGLDQVADWLAENGWTQGYATFWNGDVLTELTDGEVEVWVVTGVDSLNLYRWLQSKDHETAPEGKVFVLLQYDESLPYYSEDHLLYTDENGWMVMGYDSAEQLYELMEQENGAGAEG